MMTDDDRKEKKNESAAARIISFGPVKHASLTRAHCFPLGHPQKYIYCFFFFFYNSFSGGRCFCACAAVEEDHQVL